MRTENRSPAKQGHLAEFIFNQDSPPTTRSSRSSSSSADSSYSSCERSRSPSLTRRSQRRLHHGSRYPSSPSSSSSRSRSCPRCCRASGRSGCRHRQRSRSYSPYFRRSSHYGRRLQSNCRSSSRERHYRRSRRSRSRSSSYRRTGVSYRGRYRCRFSPLPVRRSYRSRSRSPDRSVWLNQKDKTELLNIAKDNAAKILGVEVVQLPSSVKCIEDQLTKTLDTGTEKRVRAGAVPLKKTSQDKGETDEDVEISKTSPVRKTISFNISNVIAKPSSSPTLPVSESKVTSRADSVGNRLPYGQWIPVKKVSSKKKR